uniref:Uncharacterized protein n=1 Tax=Strongyloides venezuelensis TaxID=75913 RepID=A0A0K0FDU3_STRVS
MKILQYSLFIIIYIFAIISLVVCDTEEQTIPTTIDTTISNSITHNRVSTFPGNLSGNKTIFEGKRKFKVRNQNKLTKLKKLILETESKNSTTDKNALYTNKKSNESSTDSTTNLRNKTKHQLMILQKELRRLTKIADKLSEINEIYTETKPPSTKKKADGDVKGKKNAIGKKGQSNKHKPHFTRIPHGNSESGRRFNELQSKNRGNEENKPGKWKGGKKKNQSTVKPNLNNNTTAPSVEKGRVVTSHISTRQFKRKNSRKNDGSAFPTTLTPKTINTSITPPTTILPQ